MSSSWKFDFFFAEIRETIDNFAHVYFRVIATTRYEQKRVFNYGFNYLFSTEFFSRPSELKESEWVAFSMNAKCLAIIGLFSFFSTWLPQWQQVFI